ncbi:MAG: VWA domain-containing protein [Gammaproteobacteria bacterium]|nr:VWA domain-containing protein [Gammaproteobacteria bacterium]MDH5799921.1 VWA domain-containing protein [Gammaproteobacteria bacterium]
MQSELLHYLPLRYALGLQAEPQYPQAVVKLEHIEKSLNIYLHALTRSCEIKLEPAPALRMLQRYSLHRHAHSLVRQESGIARLPQQIQRFEQKELNRDLYFWLTAYLAFDQPLPSPDSEAAHLPEALGHILQGVMTSARVLQACPGLAPRYQRLCRACLLERDRITVLHRCKSARDVDMEGAIRKALGDDSVEVSRWLHHALDAAGVGVLLPNPPKQWLEPSLAYWPAPVWGRPLQKAAALELGSFDMIDEDLIEVKPESKKAVDELDLSEYLEAPDDVTGEELSGNFLYPEWNCKTESYRENWCRVIEEEQERDDWVEPPPHLGKLSRRVRRQFEALRTDDRWLRRVTDGEEVDMDDFIDAVSQRRGCGYASERLYRHRKRDDRELAVMVLLDVSKSTQSMLDGARVIDVERQAMIVMAEALAEVGDTFSIYAFSGYGRVQVDCLRVKAFDESYGAAVRERIFSLTPRGSTRLGAALRHMAKRLRTRQERHKLLLMLTDGRPYDPADHYKGLYALEDTRKALQEMQTEGIYAYGLTIDQSGLEYLPYLFGPGRYTVFSNVLTLPEFLPKLYARLTGLGV